METPKKKTEENKNIVEKIPENLLKTIKEVMEKKGKLLNQFLQTSFQVVNAQRKQRAVADKLDSNEQSIGQKINHAFKKMKLGKKKEYGWRYDGKDSFVGQLIPKPKKEEKK